MDYTQFLSWCKTALTEFAKIGSWLTDPIIKLGSLEASPLVLLTAGGLVAFIVVAVVKWVLA